MMTVPDTALGEYQEGNILPVRFSREDRSNDVNLPRTDAEGFIEFEIVKLIKPFTDTVLCFVKHADACSEAHTSRMYFLKIYDRRHANMNRGKWSTAPGPWTLVREQRYLRYLANPRPPKRYVRGEHWDDVIQKRERQMRSAKRKAMGVEWHELSWDERCELLTDADKAELRKEFVGFTEARIAHRTEAMFRRELRAYRTLYSLLPEPGIPNLLGTVRYDSPIGSIGGLLLEYIPNSITMAQYLIAVAPCGQMADTAASVCRQVTSIFTSFSLNLPLVHGDARTDSILIEMDCEWVGGPENVRTSAKQRRSAYSARLAMGGRP